MQLMQKNIILNTEQDSILLACDIAKNLQPNNIITLSGNLGCGKTFICREIIKYYCGSEVNIISPTFNLLQTYTTSKFTIYHFDFYRLTQLEEVYELGIEDALQNNVCLIEWPNIVAPILPRAIMKIHLKIQCTY